MLFSKSMFRAYLVLGLGIASGVAPGVPFARAQVAGKSQPTGLTCRTSGYTLSIVNNVLTCSLTTSTTAKTVEGTLAPTCDRSPVTVLPGTDKCAAKFSCSPGTLVTDYAGNTDTCVKYKTTTTTVVDYQAPASI